MASTTITDLTITEFRSGDPCRDCGAKPGVRGARGLDWSCYRRHRLAGTLERFPRLGDSRGSLKESPLADGVELTYRQLDYWTRVGYLHPDGAGEGSGSRRRWSDAERAVAAMMARLVAAGLVPDAAHKVARAGGRLELAPGVTVEVDHGEHRAAGHHVPDRAVVEIKADFPDGTVPEDAPTEPAKEASGE